MTIKRLVAAMLLASASNSVLAEQSFTVKDIQVEGLQRVALGAALNNLPFNIGDTVTEYTLSKGIKSLYAAGHFDEIAVYRDGNTVTFRVKERPTINAIEFDGNKDIKEEQLNESLTGQKIIVGEPLDKTVIKEVENGLTEFYHGVGKYNATVKMKVTHPVPRELWDWLVLSGWRNVPVKNDRRSYQWLPDAALKELLDADPAQRNQAHARVLAQSKADA